MLWLTLLSFLGAKSVLTLFWNAQVSTTSKDKAQAHIDAGAKKVVISAPAGNDLPTIVYSVNENTSYS